MKNTKSKIVVPALGLILLSTAASISGSVAWFTANRTANFDAGEFAVVNTKGSLTYELGAGIGTALGNVASGEYAIKNQSGKTLTDASFDHITSDHYIFAPDSTGTKVGKKVALGSALDDGSANGLQRDNANILSAFTWTVNFTLTVPSSATQDIGLFFSANEAKMVKKVTLPSGTAVGANVYYEDIKCTTPIAAGVLESETICYTRSTAASTAVEFAASTAIPASKYYSDPECTSLYAGREAEGAAMTVYAKNEAVDTGIGFRIAFVGTTATYTTTRVWSDLQSSSNAKHVVGDAALDDLFATEGKTASYVSPALIDSDLDSDPEALTGVRSAFTGSPLYLGHFASAQAGQVVTLSYTCVAWFEGTDSHIVNNPNTVYDTMASYLAFETVNLPNA